MSAKFTSFLDMAQRATNEEFEEYMKIQNGTFMMFYGLKMIPTEMLENIVQIVLDKHNATDVPEDMGDELVKIVFDNR